MKTSLLVMLAVSALGLLGGCSNGPLTIDLVVAVEAQSVTYHLDPAGDLTVTAGGGMVEGSSGKKLYNVKLSEEELAKLKKVVANSGFFMAEQPQRGAFASGPTLVANISLGVLENRMTGSAGDIPSLLKICKELNLYLPKGMSIPAEAPAGKQNKEDLFTP